MGDEKTIPLLHAPWEIILRNIDHLIRGSQQLPVNPLVRGSPPGGLAAAGNRENHPDIGVLFPQGQHRPGGQGIKAQGPAGEEDPLSLLIKLLQRFRQLFRQQPPLSFRKAPMPCKTEAFLRPPGEFLPFGVIGQESIFSTAIKASEGTCTVPNWRIRFLPSFCFSNSFFFRVISPP